MSALEVTIMLYGLIALTMMVVVMSLREGENAGEVLVQIACALFWLPLALVLVFALLFDAAAAVRRR